jgi:outer membrane protein insertion porin family
MSLRAFRLPIIGLLLGMTLGFGFLQLKSFIKQKFVELLQDEARIACNCTLEAEQLDLSLLRFRAVAIKPTLKENGVVKMQFKKLVAYFSLAKVREKMLMISDIQMNDGFSRGVGPDSATWRFIHQLASPPPPEKNYPGRWKVKLAHLNVRNGIFSQVVPTSSGSYYLRGHVPTIEMTRDAATNYDLTLLADRLSIEKLSVDKPTELQALVGAGNEFVDPGAQNLGELDGVLYIEDHQIVLRSLTWGRGKSSLQADAVVPVPGLNAVQGNLRYAFSSEDFPEAPAALKLPLAFSVTGDASFTGSANQFQLSGATKLGAGVSSLQLSGLSKPLELQQFDARWDLQLGEQRTLTLQALEVATRYLRLTQETPLSITRERIAGSLLLEASQLAAASSAGDLPWKLPFESFSARVALADSLLSPSLQLSGTAVPLPGMATALRISSIPIRLSYAAGTLSSSLELHEGSLQRGSAQAQVQFSPNQLPELKAGSAAFDWSPGATGPTQLQIAATLEGPLSLEKLRGTLAVRGLAPQLALAGSLEQGVLKVRELKPLAPKDDGTLTIALDLPLSAQRTSQLKITWRELNIEKLLAQIRGLAPPNDVPTGEASQKYCTRSSGFLQYESSLSAILQGQGKGVLESLQIGCQPYTISASAPAKISIQAGKLEFSQVQFQGTQTSLSIAGWLDTQGIDMRINGALQLRALLGLLPRLDELAGDAQLDLRLLGNFNSLQSKGNISVRNGYLDLASAGVSARALSGNAVIRGSRIEIESLTGLVNEGTLQAKGVIEPLNLERSSLSFSIDSLLLEPAAGTAATVSATLELLKGATQRPTISGTVTIESAEMERSIDLPSLLRSFANSLFTRRKISTLPTSLPAIDVDIQVRAPRNVLIYMTWAGAELEAELRISGSLNKPVLSGEVRTLSGWFGLKDRRFEVTSASLSFRPGASEPQLQAVAETTLRSRTGDSTLIILEVQGPLSNPRVRLSSDRGLSERELLALIASGDDVSGQTLARNLRRDLKGNESVGLEALLRGRFRAFVNDLTRIDSLSIEPVYNTSSGLTEPAVVARKNLSDRLALIAQSTLASSSAESRIRALYYLGQRITLSGSIDSAPTQEDTALGADLGIALIQDDITLRISVEGNDSLSRSDILFAGKLTESTRLPKSELGRLREQLLRYYREQGFYLSEMLVTCSGPFEHCAHLTLFIEEGPLSTVTDVALKGEALPEFVAAYAARVERSTPAASRELLRGSEEQLRNLLRAEGYLSARVSALYVDTEQAAHKTLQLEVTSGQAVSFVFRGNTRFSPVELLQTIDLFTRRQPFGSNTIHILLQSIERLYREAGYLYASMDVEESSETSGRIVYTITIREEAPLSVDEVRFAGLEQLSQEQLRQRLWSSDSSIAPQVLQPQSAVAERIEMASQFIQEVLQREGFIAPKVEGQIIPDPDNASVSIEYRITEGPRLTAQAQSVCLPAALCALLQDLPTPISVPALNTYALSSLQAIRDDGYLQPRYQLELSSDQQQARLHFAAQESCTISEVVIDGPSDLVPSVITQALIVRPGNRWRTREVEESTQRLLRLGLFSRVEISPLDGALDSPSEQMLVRLSPRPLQRLEIGGGANSEYGLHLFGEARDRSLFLDGREISFTLDGYYEAQQSNVSRGTATLRYSDPSFFETGLTFNEDLRFQRVDLSTQEFDYDRLSLSSFIYGSRGDSFAWSGGHTILKDNLDNVTAGAILGPLDTGRVRLSFLSGALSLDARDSPLSPTQGSTLALDYKFATEALASEADFVSLGSRLTTIIPLPGRLQRFSLAFANQLAAGWAFAGDENLPITQRFYLGGRSSVRGFRENSLGPRGDDGAVIGGDTLFSFNAELRYQLQQDFETHIFYDAGNVYLRDRSLALSDLRYSAGAGLRYLSPIGPVGFDLGMPLDEADGEPSMRAHFSIGSNF